MHRYRVAEMLLLCGLSFAGCTEEPQPPPPPPASEALKELVPVFKYIEYSKISPPKRIEDLTQFIDSLPSAFYRIQSGEFVLIWGVGLSPSAAASTQVLAYERQAPTQGGYVLLRDGTVKHMTAAEFAAAPKAK